MLTGIDKWLLVMYKIRLLFFCFVFCFFVVVFLGEGGLFFLLLLLLLMLTFQVDLFFPTVYQLFIE